MQLDNEKTLEELRENRILEDETVFKLLESLKDDYKFFDDEDGYIYFCKNKVIEEKKQLEKLLENQFFLDKKIILENNYCVYRLYKKYEFIYDCDLKKSVENKNVNVAISVREYKMCSSKGKSSKIYFENNYKSSPPLYYLRENGIYVAYQNKGYLLSSFKQISNQIEIKEMLYQILKIKFSDWVMWKELKEKHLREIYLSFEEIFNYKTKQELIECMFNKKINFNLNKLDIRIGISFVYYMDFIKEEDYQKLYEYCKEIKYFELDMSKDDEESLGLIRIARYKRRKFGVLRLLELFLTEKINYSKSTQEQQRERGIVSDFINMSIQNNEKISLKRTSIKKIIEDHDRLVLESQLKYYKVRLKIDKKFDNLKLSKEFILLKTTKEIIKEGIIQNHCVASYIPKVNEGKCVIYTVDYNNIKYTLEIGYTPKAGYSLRQIQGYSNREIVPEELIEKIKDQLKENNIKRKSA